MVVMVPRTKEQKMQNGLVANKPWTGRSRRGSAAKQTVEVR